MFKARHTFDLGAYNSVTHTSTILDDNVMVAKEDYLQFMINWEERSDYLQHVATVYRKGNNYNIQIWAYAEEVSGGADFLRFYFIEELQGAYSVFDMSGEDIGISEALDSYLLAVHSEDVQNHFKVHHFTDEELKTINYNQVTIETESEGIFDAYSRLQVEEMRFENIAYWHLLHRINRL